MSNPQRSEVVCLFLFLSVCLSMLCSPLDRFKCYFKVLCAYCIVSKSNMLYAIFQAPPLTTLECDARYVCARTP